MVVGRARCNWGICEEVAVAALFAGEARGEVGWGCGTPGEDADVRRQQSVQDLRVDELVFSVIESESEAVVVVGLILQVGAEAVVEHSVPAGRGRDWRRGSGRFWERTVAPDTYANHLAEC